MLWLAAVGLFMFLYLGIMLIRVIDMLRLNCAALAEAMYRIRYELAKMNKRV
jgi:hypothetical protein